MESDHETTFTHEAVSTGAKQTEPTSSSVSCRMLQIVAGQPSEVNLELELTDIFPCWPLQRGWRPSGTVVREEGGVVIPSSRKGAP